MGISENQPGIPSMSVHPNATHPTPLAPRAMRRLQFVSLLSLALVAAAPAAVVPGAEPKKWPANAQKHTVVITREAADDASRRLIAAAEAAQPPRTKVQKAAGDAKLPENGPLWWYKEELGLRIPYALTREAVTYFTSLVKKYGQESFTRYAEPSSRVEYTAKVAAHDSFSHEKSTFTNVRVVTLKLTFNQNFCATGTEGLAFEKERKVVFDAAGTILLVLGDGPTETPILAI
jgi:hypothetical protein